ncbi:hypothetical protein C8D84_11855 [Psychrobacter immobilis]|uniref:Uncharacterized protein n=1 Tax=Psychrobacter immobilis TaxID=498 RepID=A0A2V1ZNQ9_PSYIM|nr:hypothetical protein [Psychrobacter immobilis]PWK06236.1 hypothetical protein C8D84_11855 [Psychrobacter immobilis]
MTQVTAMFVMFILYGVLPVAGLYLGYRGIKKMTAPKMLEYKAMPQLGYIPEKILPVEVKTALDQINEKGEKLRVIYGDTNNDGKIDDTDTVNETYIMIQNLMDRHVPLAVTDYRRLHDLDVGDGARADTTKIKHSNVTGKEALLDVLRTINTQFDDLLNASYHQDGQKLLATNRYLQKRFNNPATATDMQKLDSNVSSVNSANIEIKAIENPTGATGKNVSAENIKL